MNYPCPVCGTPAVLGSCPRCGFRERGRTDSILVGGPPGTPNVGLPATVSIGFTPAGLSDGNNQTVGQTWYGPVLGITDGAAVVEAIGQLNTSGYSGTISRVRLRCIYRITDVDNTIVSYAAIIQDSGTTEESGAWSPGFPNPVLVWQYGPWWTTINGQPITWTKLNSNLTAGVQVNITKLAGQAQVVVEGIELYLDVEYTA